MTATTLSLPRQRAPRSSVRALPGAERAATVPPSRARYVAPTRPEVTESAGLRLTRRGRLAITLTLLVLMVAGAVSFSARSAATTESGRGEATRTVVVDRGDTLWEIAAGVAAPGKVREMVHRIEELNALPGPALAEGQQLAVPLG
jgi:nucleoid-associated protein YgaU